MESNVWFDYGLEPRLLDLHAVSSGRQIGDVVTSRPVRHAFIIEVCRRVDEGYLGIRDDCLAGVSDTAGQRRICGLGLESAYKRKTEHHCKGSHFFTSHRKFPPPREPLDLLTVTIWRRNLYQYGGQELGTR